MLWGVWVLVPSLGLPGLMGSSLEPMQSPCGDCPHHPRACWSPPPGGECSFKEDLEMSNGKHLTGEPLRRFCSSEWECEIRSDMKGCAAPSPKSRRRRTGGVRLHREVIPGTTGTGIPLPPSLLPLPATKLGHT